MYHLNVLQDQWLILAIVGGAGLVLGLVLWFLAIWRPRQAPEDSPEAGSDQQRGQRPWRSFFPWILIATYVFILVYAVVYTLMVSANPPNW